MEVLYMSKVFSKVCNFVNEHKMAVSGSVMGALSAVPTFAESVTDATISTTGYIDAAWLNGLTSAVKADVGTLMPVGIALMAIFIGVGLIPRIVYKFIGCFYLGFGFCPKPLFYVLFGVI